MKQVPSISDAEWEVMKFIWAHAPVTTNDVVDTLTHTTDWKPKTVMTLLNRLVKKGALGFTKKGRVYEYQPLVRQEDCTHVESQSFLQRVYSGQLTPMLAGFLKQARLSAADVTELKRILDERKRK
jgi:BlaI family transcriptional regulator, penicillinase repressor